ncbi:hypothetical protein MUG87_00785 [Ectobacillus sp. JY-23]|uniref:hypothetical protein n=1 Tax=Ectobacillus sp. JY-23 TaxID=2933872 RepID=UPI001FF2F931|nr:hypothetical protein [Ectobacillus sp. JY-23]UOY92720.1 hypothetical protein MUG87_00785 [Ectobacillus sp. JY-23]
MKHQTSRLLYVGIFMLCCWGILGLVVKQTSHVSVMEQVPIAVDTLAPAVAHTPVLSTNAYQVMRLKGQVRATLHVLFYM